MHDVADAHIQHCHDGPDRSGPACALEVMVRVVSLVQDKPQEVRRRGQDNHDSPIAGMRLRAAQLGALHDSLKLQRPHHTDVVHRGACLCHGDA